MEAFMSVTSVKTYPVNYVSLDTPLNNQSFIQMLYKNILDRPADQGGLNFWTSELNNQLKTRDQVISAFVDSLESASKFQNPSEIVTSLYHSLLVREPDQSGLSYWSTQISSGAQKAGDIAAALAHSAEFTKLQSTNATLPTVNVLWEDFPSWDSITATQLAKLIAYSPDGGTTHPNANLNFIVSGVGPNSTLSALTPISHNGKATAFSNTPDGLYQFIKSISDQVSSITSQDANPVKWGVKGGTGFISYHPDSTSADFVKDWAGWSPKDNSFTLTSDPSSSYQAYIDYSLYLNQYLTSKGLKGFNEVVFETEASGYNANQLFGEYGQQSGLIFKYAGNSTLLKANGSASNWHTLFSADATIGPTNNWNAALNGFASDKYLAQSYDLVGAGYIPDWTGPSVLDPGKVTPAKAASDFANFFANASDANPTQGLNNIKNLISPPGNNQMGTTFNPNASIVFSYGIREDQPLFQNDQYVGNTPQPQPPKDPNAAYRWSANDFANFLAVPGSSSDFEAQLIQNLQSIATKFNPAVTTNFNAEDLIIAVWGGERALDAWIGF